MDQCSDWSMFFGMLKCRVEMEEISRCFCRLSKLIVSSMCVCGLFLFFRFMRSAHPTNDFCKFLSLSVWFCQERCNLTHEALRVTLF